MWRTMGALCLCLWHTGSNPPWNENWLRDKLEADIATVIFSGLDCATYAVSKVAIGCIRDGVSLCTVPPLRGRPDQTANPANLHNLHTRTFFLA